jgi:hypothetical protein
MLCDVYVSLIEIGQFGNGDPVGIRECIVTPLNFKPVPVGLAEGVGKGGNGNLVGKIINLCKGNLTCPVVRSLNRS